MTGRKNAMLTTEDRRWLTGEKSYEGQHAKQQRYQRRRDIRSRVRNTILDFTILFEHLEESEREKLFDRPDEDGETDDEFTNGLRDALAFVLYNTGITESMEREGSERSVPLAERLLQDAVYRAGKRDEILVEDVDLAIEATRAPVSAILEDLKAGNEVSPARLCLLLESDEIDTARAQDCIREMILDDG
jgi:hypothetical protein